MAANEIHLYDIGTQFDVTVKDNATTLNVSSACIKQFEFLKPSRAKVTVAASFNTTGSDGKLCYTTAASNFLNEIGDWQLQVYLEMSTGIWHSDIHAFRVYGNL